MENEENMSIKHAVCVLAAIGNGLTLSNENDREDACVLAIKSIDELLQYKAIGTVEYFKLLKGHYRTLNEMCKEYSAIGTIEEFKALKEKQIPKKPLIEYHCGLENRCPTCNCEVSDIEHRKWSCKCGQILDWQ